MHASKTRMLFATIMIPFVMRASNANANSIGTATSPTLWTRPASAATLTSAGQHDQGMSECVDNPSTHPAQGQSTDGGGGGSGWCKENYDGLGNCNPEVNPTFAVLQCAGTCAEKFPSYDYACYKPAQPREQEQGQEQTAHAAGRKQRGSSSSRRGRREDAESTTLAETFKASERTSEHSCAVAAFETANAAADVQVLQASGGGTDSGASTSAWCTSCPEGYKGAALMPDGLQLKNGSLLLSDCTTCSPETHTKVVDVVTSQSWCTTTDCIPECAAGQYYKFDVQTHTSWNGWSASITAGSYENWESSCRMQELDAGALAPDSADRLRCVPCPAGTFAEAPGKRFECTPCTASGLVGAEFEEDSAEGISNPAECYKLTTLKASSELAFCTDYVGIEAVTSITLDQCAAYADENGLVFSAEPQCQDENPAQCDSLLVTSGLDCSQTLPIDGKPTKIENYCKFSCKSCWAPETENGGKRSIQDMPTGCVQMEGGANEIRYFTADENDAEVGFYTYNGLQPFAPICKKHICDVITNATLADDFWSLSEGDACRGPACLQATRAADDVAVLAANASSSIAVVGPLDFFDPSCAFTSKWAADQADSMNIEYLLFYTAAAAIAGSCAFCWCVFALCISVDGGRHGCCGDDHDKYEHSNPVVHSFYASMLAGFAASRLFDMMSDWALYYISFHNQLFTECSIYLFKPDPEMIKRVSLAFCIIGTILTPFDLLSLTFRYDAFTKSSPEKGRFFMVALCTCMVVWLEDVPQLILSVMYLETVNDPQCIFNTTAADRTEYNQIAFVSLILSAVSLAINIGIGAHFLIKSPMCCGSD